jgi:hypothetical protein
LSFVLLELPTMPTKIILAALGFFLLAFWTAVLVLVLGM